MYGGSPHEALGGFLHLAPGGAGRLGLEGGTEVEMDSEVDEDDDPQVGR